MRIFITSKNKYLSNEMKIFGTCSISLKTKKIRFCLVSLQMLSDMRRQFADLLHEMKFLQNRDPKASDANVNSGKLLKNLQPSLFRHWTLN